MKIEYFINQMLEKINRAELNLNYDILIKENAKEDETNISK